MKAMQVSMLLGLFFLHTMYTLNSLYLPNASHIIKVIILDSPTAVAYVQDTVQIAVKLKSRFTKPSIIVLPMVSITKSGLGVFDNNHTS